jgi:hypothetical protein
LSLFVPESARSLFEVPSRTNELIAFVSGAVLLPLVPATLFYVPLSAANLAIILTFATFAGAMIRNGIGYRRDRLRREAEVAALRDRIVQSVD